MFIYIPSSRGKRFFLTLFTFIFLCSSNSKLFADNNDPPEIDKNDQITIIPNIVGGTEVVPGRRSYQAMLLFNGEQGCGGTLIEDYWVITAAHCLDRANTNNLSVRLGAHYRSGGGTTHRVSQIVRHPSWGGGGVVGGYDIALLRLATPAADNLKRAKLPTQAIQNELAAPGRYLTVSGWGRTYNGGPASNVLLEVGLPVLTTQQCRQQLSPSINGTVICGGGPNNTSACNGDSGGPFVAEKNGIFYSMGTVSWGRSCRGATAFTRTLSYVSWIKNFVDFDDDDDNGGGSQGELSNGVPITVNGARASEKFFTINVPDGAKNLVISISGGTGDADLFVRAGQRPTTNNFDCRPYRNGNQEVCRFAQARGVYHIMLNAWRAYNNVTLRASYEIDDDGGTGGPSPINAVLRNIYVPQASWKRYVIDLPAGYSQVKFSIAGGNGEVDLYINYGSPSTWGDYDCRPAKYGNDETCSFSNPSAGRWYIDLYGFYNSQGITLTTLAN